MFYKIGEFSKLVGIPVKTLRYYDECDVLNEMVGFINMLSSGIARNIKFYISTRFMEKLYETYGYYLNINSIEKDTTLNNEVLEYLDSNIDYPLLEINDIRVFDLEKFFADKNVLLPKKDEMDYVNYNKINDLINKIDSKIQELDSGNEI